MFIQIVRRNIYFRPAVSVNDFLISSARSRCLLARSIAWGGVCLFRRTEIMQQHNEHHRHHVNPRKNDDGYQSVSIHLDEIASDEQIEKSGHREETTSVCFEVSPP